MNLTTNNKLNSRTKVFKIDIILIGILFLAAVLRIYHLGFQGVWLDELHTLKEADPNLTFKEFHEIIMWREGIPHFYFLIVRFFGFIFTHTVWSIRLVSAVSGILAVYTIYLLGKEMKGKNLGYMAAILLTLHPFHIEHSQEGRSYSLLVLLVIISFYRMILFLKQSNLKNALLLGLFLGLITNAHPIGIVNVISIYLIIFLSFFLINKKEDKISYIINTFLSGIITMLVFFPVYQIVSKVSEIKSFWVQKPSYDYIIEILTTLTGGNKIVFYLTMFSLVFILIKIVYIFKTKKVLELKNDFINYITILIWILFFFLFILERSSGEASLFLNRYFISLIPAFILAFLLMIDNLKYSYIKFSIVFLISILFLYVILIEKKYYTTRVKSQFNDLCAEVITLNPDKETIVSNWGWLLTYYLDRENTIKNVYEKNLDDHITHIKTNAIEKESFWYLDGNSRPFQVESETENFLNENFILERSIELNDCWAKHYVSKEIKNQKDIYLKLNQFSNSILDGSGNLMFFENSKCISPKIKLKEGNYKLEIAALSLPLIKINNENAKFKVFANFKLIGIIEASEKKTTIYDFNLAIDKTNTLQIEIDFINDFSKDKLDRNLQISKIQLKVIEK